MSSQSQTVNPTIQAFQKRIDALSDFKVSLKALADNTGIGKYSYRIGMGEVKPGVLGGIVSVVSETAPKADATMPPRWKAPSGGSSFFLLNLDGADVPVLISALDQDELEGRIGNCLVMTFNVPPNDKSNSTLGYTVTVNGTEHYSIGCGHYVRPGVKKSGGSSGKAATPGREQLAGVTTCGANCARCAIGKCHNSEIETPGPHAIWKDMQRNGQWVANQLCTAVVDKETINLAGSQVLINRANYDPLQSPDLCIYPLASPAMATPLHFDTCKTGWIRYINHIMIESAALDDAGLLAARAVFENLDGIGEPIGITDLQTARQNNHNNEFVYACTRGSHATFMVGYVDTINELIEPGKVAIGSLCAAGKPAKKLCQMGDCGSPWFAVIKDPLNNGRFQLRLLGHHRGSHPKPWFQALLVPWEATLAELRNILPAPAAGAPPLAFTIAPPITMVDQAPAPAPPAPIPVAIPAPAPAPTPAPVPQSDGPKPDAKRKLEQAGADDSKRQKP